MALETLPWDPAEHLKTAEDVREYLEAAFEDGDPALIAAALGDVARARGMTEIAREAGISREAMYKAFRPEGNPTLETLARVIRALGLKLTVRAGRGSTRPEPENEMSYDLDAMQAQITAAMEKPDRERFRPGASYDPKRRLRDYDYRQYGYNPENMTILGSSTSWKATVNAEAGLHQRMRSHPRYDRRPQQPQSLGRDDKSRYYIYFAWTDLSSKTTWERMKDLVEALLRRDPTGAEVVRITNDEMFRRIRMGSPQYVLKIGPAQVHYHRSWCYRINYPLVPKLKAAFASLSLQGLIDEAENPSWEAKYRNRDNWIPCEYCLRKSDPV